MGCDFGGESLSRESWYDAVADLQVSDGPDHRKKNCSTANKVNQHKHLNQSKFATEPPHGLYFRLIRLISSYSDVLLPLSKSCDLSLPDLILPEWYTPHWIWPVIWEWQRMRKFNLSNDLSWQDHHEHFLFVAAEHMLHESPPRADQDYCEKEESTLQVCSRHIIRQRHGFDHLQKMSDIVQDCPRLFVYTIGSNLGVVDLNITD